MPKKKKSRASVSAPLSVRSSTIWGSLFIFLGVLAVGWDKSSLGSVLAGLLDALFADASALLFAPTLFLLGVSLVFKKSQWEAAKFVWLACFWIFGTTLYAFFQPEAKTGLLSIHTFFSGFIGVIPSIFLFLVFFLLTAGTLWEVAIFALLYKGLIKGFQKWGNYMVAGAKNATQHIIHSQLSPIGNNIDEEREEIQKEEKGKKNGKNNSKNDKEEEEILLLKKQILQLEKEKEILDLARKNNKNLKGNEKYKEEEMREKVESKLIPIQIKMPKIFSKNIEKEEEKKVEENGNHTEITTEGKKRFGGFWDTKWELPPFDLLQKFDEKPSIDLHTLRARQQEIEDTLEQFRVRVDMEDFVVGPTVVQYRLKPAEGVKLSRIEALKKDLTLALKAKSIRIQAPIPGLGLVGLEVPNENRSIVSLRELMESREFQLHPSKLTLALGKDIGGNLIVGDMAKMPHLLVAGQTGSGKSVAVNGFLLSLLYKNSPQTLRLILIDLKRVELSIYNGIPHLLSPVITSGEKALNSLKWSVAEMLRRYDLFTQKRARNLDEYNQKVSKEEQMPSIVIVIDELAELMMSGFKRDVESAIVRLAQMARATGMHLIVATQRPSVDVITGLIKANIPSRVAFTVASQIDSRTILDRMGAEDLLGKGDMLYAPVGSSYPERIQGVLVETEEVEAIVTHIRFTIDPEMLESLYDPTITELPREEGYVSANSSGGGDEDAEVIKEAIRIVQESNKASTSFLQRRLKLGYARAARLMDILEDMGVVGPGDGSKPREVFTR